MAPEQGEWLLAPTYPFAFDTAGRSSSSSRSSSTRRKEEATTPAAAAAAPTPTASTTPAAAAAAPTPTTTTTTTTSTGACVRGGVLLLLPPLLGGSGPGTGTVTCERGKEGRGCESDAWVDEFLTRRQIGSQCGHCAWRQDRQGAPSHFSRACERGRRPSLSFLAGGASEQASTTNQPPASPHPHTTYLGGVPLLSRKEEEDEDEEEEEEEEERVCGMCNAPGASQRKVERGRREQPPTRRGGRKGASDGPCRRALLALW